MAHGAAGHTLMGGIPNVNQGIGRAVDRILRFQISASERLSTWQCSKAAPSSITSRTEGWFSLDIRSPDAAKVGAIEATVRQILNQVAAETGTTLTLEPVQLTPGGQIPGAAESPLVTTSAVDRSPTGADGGVERRRIVEHERRHRWRNACHRPWRRTWRTSGGAWEFADIPAMVRSAKHVVLLAATIGAK